MYDRIGGQYLRARQEDPRIAALLWAALADASPVVNVGAGAGSYEPGDRPVVAVEPSAVMLAQRQAGAAPAVRAVAEALPFGDNAFGAAMGVLTVHHWSDRARGLAEMRRVARGPVVLFTRDPRADQPVSCEPAGQRSSGRRGGRGDRAAAGATAPPAVDGVAARPRPGRQLPAGAPLLH